MSEKLTLEISIRSDQYSHTMVRSYPITVDAGHLSNALFTEITEQAQQSILKATRLPVMPVVSKATHMQCSCNTKG